MTRQPAGTEATRFPLWVAWCSLVVTLAVFFCNTVPSFRERNELRFTAAEMGLLREQYLAAIAVARGAVAVEGAPVDLQSTLVAIDSFGWTPDDVERNAGQLLPSRGAGNGTAPGPR